MMGYFYKRVLKALQAVFKDCNKQKRLECGAEWIRTTDSRIFSPMLYQLSYSTKKFGLTKVGNSVKRQNTV